MKVKDLMSRNAVTAGAETPFEKIWELIFEKRVSVIPIVGKLNVLMGIISEEDLIEKLYPSYADYLFDPQSRDFEKMEDKIADVSGLKAKHLMSKNVYTTTEEAPISSFTSGWSSGIPFAAWSQTSGGPFPPRKTTRLRPPRSSTLSCFSSSVTFMRSSAQGEGQVSQARRVCPWATSDPPTRRTGGAGAG